MVYANFQDLMPLLIPGPKALPSPRLLKSRASSHRHADSGGVGSRAAEEWEESGGYSFLFVKEEIFRNPKRAVGTYQSHANHESRDEDRSNAGEENDEDAETNQED